MRQVVRSPADLSFLLATCRTLLAGFRRRLTSTGKEAGGWYWRNTWLDDMAWDKSELVGGRGGGSGGRGRGAMGTKEGIVGLKGVSGLPLMCGFHVNHIAKQ